MPTFTDQGERGITSTQSPTTKEYERFSNSLEWWNYMSRLQQDPAERERVGKLIAVREAVSLSEITPQQLPPVKWVEDVGINNILGARLLLPVMEFDNKNIQIYKHLTGDMLQGQARSIDIDECPQKPFRYVALPSAEFDDQFPVAYEQRRRHEFGHLIDAGDGIRNGLDEPILSEIVAVATECATPEWDFAQVSVWEGFFESYLHDDKRLAQSHRAGHDLIEWVRGKTVGKKNSEIVRELMFQVSNPELVGIIKKTPKRRLEFILGL